MTKRLILTAAAVVALLAASAEPSAAFTFTKVTDVSNPIVTDPGAGGGDYYGASWVDYDGDGDIDLFANPNDLYRNDGGGVFAQILGSGLGSENVVNPGFTMDGGSWADHDEDGDPDAFCAGVVGALYQNAGGVFTAVETGGLGDLSANRGWSCAWADYDNDGWVDLVIAHPADFIPGAPLPNHLFHNSGAPGWSFTRVTSEPITDGLAPYTVATWADYDDDGDQDLFIGSGPANGTVAPDFLFRNLLTETGQPQFERITDAPIATDPQDGQVWNWIDYDNDGDLDCFVATDGPTKDWLYQNNGGGSFTSIITTPLTAVAFATRGATAGDYDDDGDVDLYVNAPTTRRSLYRNDEASGNKWLSLNLVGTVSNRSAIGARVRVKATVSGVPTWQRRDISAQNTFQGQNDLRAHFGLRDAATADSVEIRWPSGIVQVLSNVAANQKLTVTEPTSADVQGALTPPPNSMIRGVWPQPFSDSVELRLVLSSGATGAFSIHDANGRRVREISVLASQAVVRWDGRDQSGREMAAGLYLGRLAAADREETVRLLLAR